MIGQHGDSMGDIMAERLREKIKPEPMFVGDMLVSVDRALIENYRTEEMASFVLKHHVGKAVEQAKRAWAEGSAAHVTLGVIFVALPKDEFEEQLVRDAHAKLIEDQNHNG